MLGVQGILSIKDHRIYRFLSLPLLSFVSLLEWLFSITLSLPTLYNLCPRQLAINNIFLYVFHISVYTRNYPTSLVVAIDVLIRFCAAIYASLGKTLHRALRMPNLSIVYFPFVHFLPFGVSFLFLCVVFFFFGVVFSRSTMFSSKVRFVTSARTLRLPCLTRGHRFQIHRAIFATRSKKLQRSAPTIVFSSDVL